MKNLTIILAQLNFIVGDIQGNGQKIINTSIDAKKNQQADVIVFPELALTGYPPEDLLYRQDFLDQTTRTLEKIILSLPEDIAVIIGYPEQANPNDSVLYNSAIVIYNHQKIAHYRKRFLPNDSVFDEKRYFTAGEHVSVFDYQGCHIGLLICEDLWNMHPVQETKQAGADILITLNASPFHTGKLETRLLQLKTVIQKTNLAVVYVNHCCGQDDLIFDGSSVVLNRSGHVIAQAPFAKEALLRVHLAELITETVITTHHTQPMKNNPQENIYQAILLGMRDYARKNHFQKVLLGFSGGIDSALTLVLAVDAMGKNNVLPLILPSRYTSALSMRSIAQQLNMMALIDYEEISIEPVFECFLSSLGLTPSLSHHQNDNLTIQNIQARIRGVMLMARANQLNGLLLNTSNKSELAVGYGTLYGDMCGGYAPIKDLWKTDVYQLARYRNTLSPVIPEDIIQRPPSAELAPDQQDTDNLPPYFILDEISKQYIEQDKSLLDIVQSGFHAADVKKVLKLIQQSEYKRKQGPPGPRVSKKAFTRERRYPITCQALI